MDARWMTLALLVGCGGSTPEKRQDPGTTEVALPSPYVADETSVPEPTADPAEVAAALQAGVDAAPQVSPVAVRQAYEAAMATSDGACPYFFTGPDGDYWFDDCNSQLGSAFSGFVFALDQPGYVDPSTGLTIDTWYVSGAASVVTGAAETLVVGGTAYEVSYTDGMSTTWQSIVQGSFSWNGPEAAGTWMAADYDPDLVSTFVSYPDTGGMAAVFDGGVGRLGDQGQWSIAFDNALMANLGLGSPCGEEPSGTISVRTADGSWYDIRFHGPDPDTFQPSGTCDGCGDVFFHGEPAGEVCADFSSWVGWGGAPW